MATPRPAKLTRTSHPRRARNAAAASAPAGGPSVSAAAIESARECARMIEHLPAGAVYVKEERLTMNRAAEEITGYGRDELASLDAWFAALYGERAHEVRQIYRANREGGFPHRSPALPIRRKDRQERYVEFAGYRFEDAEVWLMYDVSERKALERHLADGATEERAHLARELHDGILGLVSGIAILAQTLHGQLEKEGSPLAARARDLAESVLDAQARLRTVTTGLMPVEALPEGLMAALRGLAEECTSAHDVGCRFVCDPPVPVPDVAAATHLFRIAQEAVTNAIRHGEAREILVALRQDRDTLELVVSDDGRGLGRSARDQPGLGLHTMQQRARLLRGGVTVGPRTPHGVVVTCRVPKPAGDGARTAGEAIPKGEGRATGD
jgi:two-component system, LuxR family, sensor kinase FixL